MATHKAYVLYFPTGVSFKTAAHELAATTTMKSLQKNLTAPTVRWILGSDGISNKHDSCELNEQSCIRIDSHAIGKKDSREYWSGTCTKKSAINALTRRNNGDFRVRSTTGVISINFGQSMSKVSGTDLGMGALAKGLVPGAHGISQIFGAIEGLRQGFSLGRQNASARESIVFYMEALQGIRTPLSISCPAEGVSLAVIAEHLRSHGFPSASEAYEKDTEWKD